MLGVCSCSSLYLWSWVANLDKNYHFPYLIYWLTWFVDQFQLIHRHDISRPSSDLYYNFINAYLLAY